MNTLPTLVLGNVILPAGRVVDITLAGGKVAHVGAGSKTTEFINCTGYIALAISSRRTAKRSTWRRVARHGNF